MNLKEASVLLVEDEPLLRETMGVWLNHKAGRGLTAEHGAEALKLLADNKINLIISDVRMPVMDGIALVRHLNQAGSHRPGVIFLSGFSDLSLREVYHLGVEGVLEKPIDREELLGLMQRSVAEADELWRQPPGARPRMRLKARFPSLGAAQEEKGIAFGRRGFCIRSANLREGPVEFAIEFEADRCVLAGQGVVRWTAPEEGQAGIEIVYVDDASRAWLLDLVKRTGPVPFIPRSAARHAASSLEAA
jgi:CheY-like chemotaxis protein